MRKLILLAAGLLFAVAFAGCSSGRKAKSVPMTEGEVEVTIPLSGPEYRSDAGYWRATQMGESRDAAMAKKLAMQNTRQELAALVQAEVQAVIENYGQNAAIAGKNINEGLYQELTRTVVKQQLNGLEVVGEKLFKLANGDFRYHICLQMSKEALEEKVSEVLSNDERLRLEFDREQFKKIFNEEMEKFARK